MHVARLAIILAVLTAIGAARVQLARREDRGRYEVHSGLTRQVHLRRRLWDQRTRIGELLAPERIRRRTVEMALDLTGEDESRSRVAAGAGPDGGRE